MRRLAAFALAAGLAGCSEGGRREAGPTRIDGSSAAAFARTTRIAREEVSGADRMTFDGAIATMPARRYGDRDPDATARAAFDGLTAAEVVTSERQRSSGRR